MIIISHRGNTHGPNPLTENKPETIDYAIGLGFDCEIDVWYERDTFWLGHDKPETEVSIEFFRKHGSSLWIHCKNLYALIRLKDEFNCFFHDKDVYTLTSKGYIWGNIGSLMTKNTIQVMTEKAYYQESLGVCTDYPIRHVYLNEETPA